MHKIKYLILIIVLATNFGVVSSAFAQQANDPYSVACPAGQVWTGSACVGSPSSISGTCPSPGTSATISWASTGAPKYSYRIDDTIDGWVGGNDYYGDTTGTSFSFTGVAGRTYSIWVHSRGTDDAWSEPPRAASFSCARDGGWSSWSAYGSCSVTACGSSGTKTRTRACDNPAPAYGGADCVGPSSESTSCSTAACPVDGGWSAWSAQNTSCGYSGTQTRTCTNPAPAYGGADCVGPSSQSYTNSPCPINGACSASHYSCAAGSSVSNADNGSYWSWTCAGLYGGSNASCSESVPIPSPTLYIINTPYIGDWTQSGTTYYGAPYTVYWGAVANASWCTLNGGAVTTGAGSSSGSASWSNTQTFTLTCGSGGGSRSSSVTISVPPPVTSISSSCSANGQSGSLSWGAPSGWNTFYTRVYDVTAGAYVYPATDDGATGTSKSFATIPGHSYSSWVHTRAGNGAWSYETYTYTTCPNPSPTVSLNIKDSWGYPNYVHQNISTYGWNDTGVALSWSSTDATACTVYDNGTPRWSGTASSGVAVGAIGGISHTYTINCTNSYSGVTGTDTRVLTIPAAPTSVAFGSCNQDNTITLSWNQNPAYGRGAPYIYDNGALVYNGDAIPVGGSGSSTVTSNPGHTYTAVVYARDARESSWPYSNGVNPAAVTCGMPTGWLTVTSACTIPVNGSTCSVPLSWGISNGYAGGANAVTYNSVNGYGSGTVAGTTARSGSSSQSISYGQNNFFLYHNGSQLATQSASAVCAASSAWSGSACVPAPTVSISASPSFLNNYGTSVVSWSSTNATSCTVSGYGAPGSTTASGSFTTPTITSSTTYNIDCVGPAGNGYGSTQILLDICSDLSGYQSVPPTGTTRKADGTCTPVCVNFPDNTVVPPGWTRDSNSVCSGGPNPICPNIPNVTAVPTGYTVNNGGSCIPDKTSCNGNDYCPNINGQQTSIPAGFSVTNAGICTPNNGDYCSNISGTQNTMPPSQTLSSTSTCIEWDKTTCPASAATPTKAQTVYIEF